MSAYKATRRRGAYVFVAVLFLFAQAISTAAIALVSTPKVEAAPVCMNDTAGANDEPVQKDLTKLCIDYSALPNALTATWNWDETGTSGANTMDACTLFDTDGDGNINYAVCVTTENDPATLKTLTTYSCGDAKIDRCTTPATAISSGATSCTVTQQNTDPFASGSSAPKDTQGSCVVQLSAIGGITAKLIDVCSYPSAQPNSDPSDCVIIRDSAGKVEVIKDIVPDTNTGLFNLSIDGSQANDTTTVNNVGDNGTTGEVVVKDGTVTVGETAGTNTSLSSYSTTIVCRDLNGTGNIVAQTSPTGTPRTLAFTLADQADVVCRITNTAAGSITIKKNAIANGLQDFQFTATGTGVSGFTLDDDSGVTGADSVNSDTKTFNNLGAGTYTFTEAEVSGWYLDAIDCPNITETQNLSTRTVSLTISAGQNVTCTFTNRQLGQIKVTKQTNPNNDPTQFSTSASPSGGVVGSASQSISDDQTVTYTVKHGTYSVSETVPSGWSMTSNTCSSMVVDGNTPLTNGVPTRTCVISNTKLAGLTIIKNAIPDGPKDFTFSASGQGVSGFILDDDADGTRSNQQQFTDLSPGAYTFTETDDEGWDLTGLTCSGTGADYSVNSNAVTVNLGAGQTITCTFTNTQRGSISGVKFNDANGNGAYDQGEELLGNWTVFIDINGNGELDQDEISMLTDSNGLYTFLDLQPSSYNLAEVMQSGWVQTLSPGTVILNAGQNLTGQAFGNFLNGSISGHKYNDINGDGQKGENEPKLSGWTINLLNDGEDIDSLLDDIVQTTQTGQDGDYSFQNVARGTYQVCEIQQNGWTQTHPENSGCHTIVIDQSGEINSNTNFGNQGRGSITVYKNADTDGDGDVDVTGSTEWTYDIDGSGNYATGSSQNIVAGTYTVKEDQQANYHFVSVSCSGEREVSQSEEVSVTVSPGESVVCTFVNARDTGKIEVIKHLVPSNDSGKFNLKINGEVKAENVGHEGTTGEITVSTGEYDISEAAGVETNLSDYIAEIGGDCNSEGKVTVTKNATLTCEITNTRKASITVIKDAIPDHEQNFDFTISKYEPVYEELPSLLDQVSELSIGGDNNLIAEFTLDDDGDPKNELPDKLTQNGLVPGVYIIEEKAVEGWDLIGIECDDETVDRVLTGSEEQGTTRVVEVNPGQEVICTYTNQKRGSVTIIKDALPNSSQEFTFGHNFDGEESENFTLVDDGINPLNAKKVFTDVYPGEYYIDEQPEYGWKFAGVVCDNEEYDEDGEEEYYYRSVIVDNSHTINVASGEDLTCIITNEVVNPKITIIKRVINDDGNDAAASDFRFNLTLNGSVSGSDNFPYNPYDPYESSTTASLTPGSYKVTEDEAIGYTASYEGCEGTLGFGDRQVCIITNDDKPPVVEITKSNNRPLPTVAGDTVTYMLKVSVPENSGVVYNSVVTDLPPDNFEYVAGTFTVSSSERGDMRLAGITPEPSYASPGNWQLGDLMPGEEVVLTYEAKISSNVTPGVYPDIAFVKGTAGQSDESAEVLGNVQIADTPFVGTQVSVITLASASFTPPEVLVETGMKMPYILAAIPAFLLGLTAFAYRRSRRIVQEGGQQ